MSPAAASVDRQPPHLVEQRPQADSQQARRLTAVAARGLERALDGAALHRLDLALEIERAVPVRAVGTIGAVAVQVAPVDAVLVAIAEREAPGIERPVSPEHGRPLHRVPKLPHVAGPAVAGERRERRRRDAYRVAQALRR